jgi:hypothetical protein
MRLIDLGLAVAAIRAGQKRERKSRNWIRDDLLLGRPAPAHLPKRGGCDNERGGAETSGNSDLSEVHVRFHFSRMAIFAATAPDVNAKRE